MPPQTRMEAARKRLAEASTEDAARFIRSFARSRHEVAQTTDGGVRGIFSLIALASREIRARLAPFLIVTADNFEQAATPLIIRELRGALSTLQNEASKLLTGSLTTSFGMGERVTATALRSVNVPVVFPTVSPLVLDAAVSATGNVFTEMLTNLGDRIINEVQSSVLGVRSGTQALRRIERMLSTSTEVRRGLRRRIGLGFQAETIARTEINRIYSQAQQAAAEQISETVPGLKKKWVTTLRERRGHREAEARYAVGGATGPIPISQRFEVKDYTRIGSSNFLTLGGRAGAGPQRVVRTAQAFNRRGRVITDRMLHPRDSAGSAGNVINCLLPDCHASGNFIFGLKAFYSGPAREIHTLAGARLTLTVNHPVLTDEGWVLAGELQDGDCLLGDSRQINRTFGRIGNNNSKKDPVQAKDVFESMCRQGSIRKIGVGAGDLYGDAKFGNGQIEIVGTDGKLLDDFISSISQRISQRRFVFSDRPIKAFHSGFGLLDQRRPAGLLAPSGAPCSGTGVLDMPSVVFPGGPGHGLGFGRGSQSDVPFFQYPIDRSPRYSEKFGEGQNRLPGAIASDQIIGIREFDFSGHVYDFQSTNGLIQSQGIYISNCTCVVIEVLPEIEAATERASGILSMEEI